MIIEGRARILGDDINTDYIISSRRKRQSIDERTLAAHLLEGVDPAFAASVRPGDILVAGRNFGCGSAMEVAATVIRAAGIGAVVATSFSRSFYRNAINNGLPAIVCDMSGTAEGESLRIELGDAGGHVEAHGRSVRRAVAPMPPMMRDILGAGGLVAYLGKHGRFVTSGNPG